MLGVNAFLVNRTNTAEVLAGSGQPDIHIPCSDFPSFPVTFIG